MGLEIEEWEIWHTYTTYFEATEIDLSETARRLVAADVAECAMSRDGRTYWRSDAAVSSGSTEIDVDLVTGESTFRLRFDDGCKKPEGFAPEAWGQASSLMITGTRGFELSGALYTHEQLVKAGVNTELHVWEGLFHAFFYNTEVPESKDALNVIVKFFDRHLEP
jgi:acetyl esterase/lipase